MEHLAERLAAIPNVVAVTLGGSRATGAAGDDSDWDFGLYYRDSIDPAQISALGWAGRVFAPGDWGTIVNGGAWLEVDGAKVDLIYRNLDEVGHWLREAEAGRFEIRREVGYVAGIATYILVGELALHRVLVGELPKPSFPAALAETAPPEWYNLAAGALHFAQVHAMRSDRASSLANLCQAVLATAEGRLAARCEWALNEKGIVARAGLDDIQQLLDDADHDLPALIAATDQVLDLPASLWRSS